MPNPARGGREDEGGAESPDLVGLGAELARQLAEVGKQVRSGFEQVAEDAQYAFDKEMAKLFAKHPELYAEIRKTMRQAQRTLDKAAEALGIDPKK